MARKQVLVQLDDEMVARLDAVAARHGISRSELMRRFAEVLLDADDEADAIRRDIAGYTRYPQDPALNEEYRRAASEAWAELPW